MKNIVILIAVVIVIWGVYSFISKEPLPNPNTPAAKMFRDYETIVSKYEKQGVKTPDDMTKLSVDMRLFMTKSQTTTIDAAEAKYYMKKGEELNNRVMKLVQGR